MNATKPFHLTREIEVLQSVIDADLQMMAMLTRFERDAKRLGKDHVFLAEIRDRRDDIQRRREEMIETIEDREFQLKARTTEV